MRRRRRRKKREEGRGLGAATGESSPRKAATCNDGHCRGRRQMDGEFVDDRRQTSSSSSSSFLLLLLLLLLLILLLLFLLLHLLLLLLLLLTFRLILTLFFTILPPPPPQRSSDHQILLRLLAPRRLQVRLRRADHLDGRSASNLEPKDRRPKGDWRAPELRGCKTIGSRIQYV